MGRAAAVIDKTQRSDLSLDDKRRREMDAVLSRYLPSFHRQAYRHLGNAADAEDAVQDALLSAYKHLGQFRGQARMSTWLARIITNSAHMQLRRRPRGTHIPLDEQTREHGSYPLSERLPDRRPNPEEAFRRLEHVEHIAQLARQLSPNLRRAFQLRDLDGLTIQEMTDILKAPEGTVKTHIARARAKLSISYRGRKPATQLSPKKAIA